MQFFADSILKIKSKGFLQNTIRKLIVVLQMWNFACTCIVIENTEIIVDASKFCFACSIGAIVSI